MPPLKRGSAENYNIGHNYIPCPMQRHQKFAQNHTLLSGFGAHEFTNFNPFLALPAQI